MKTIALLITAAAIGCTNDHFSTTIISQKMIDGGPGAGALGNAHAGSESAQDSGVSPDGSSRNDAGRALDAGEANSAAASSDAQANAGADGGPERDASMCQDTDRDGVCDAVDVCPIGSDADDNANGYPDACEKLLWRQSVHGTDIFFASPQHADGMPLFVKLAPSAPGCASSLPAVCGNSGLGDTLPALPGEDRSDIYPAGALPVSNMIACIQGMGACTDVLKYSARAYLGKPGATTGASGVAVGSLLDPPSIAGKTVLYVKRAVTMYSNADKNSGNTVSFWVTFSVYGY